MTRAALVLAGGDPVAPALRHLLGHLLEPARSEGTLVIAADSGIAHAAGLGLQVDEIVGDFDSADPATVDAAVAAGARVERHPADKDATDLELALGTALARGAEDITVIGGAGGRLDHFLANVAVMASPRFSAATVTAFMDRAHLAVVHGGRSHTISGRPGTLVSLLPANGVARGVTTSGLHYPLRDEDLPPGTSRGVSNLLEAVTAVVTLRDGTLVVVQPEGGAR